MRNRIKRVQPRPTTSRLSQSPRPELLIPAATTILALLLGAAINSYESRRLERQKFEFEVLKYVVGASPEASGRLKLLCQFSNLGFIPDPDRRYHRAEIGGVRVCAANDGMRAPSAMLVAHLRDEIGVSRSSAGAPTFENGVLKIEGGVGDVREPTRPIPGYVALRRIEIFSVAAGGEKGVDGVEKAARLARADLIVDRDGEITQLENVYSGSGVVRLGLLNLGTLHFGTEVRGIGFKLYDRTGRMVPRSEGLAYRQTSTGTEGRHRLTQVQLAATQGLVASLCSLGRPKVFASHYVSETAAMSSKGFRFSACKYLPHKPSR